MANAEKVSCTCTCTHTLKDRRSERKTHKNASNKKKAKNKMFFIFQNTRRSAISESSLSAPATVPTKLLVESIIKCLMLKRK